MLGRPVKDGGYIAGTIIKPKLGLRPEPFAAAAYQFWLGGDFIKNDEPQGNQTFAPMKKTIPLVVDAMRRAMDKTGEAKIFSANITADDHYEMMAVSYTHLPSAPRRCAASRPMKCAAWRATTPRRGPPPSG